MVVRPERLKQRELNLIKIFLILFLALQGFFWFKTEKIKPKLGIIPDVPNFYSIKALSFGDEEFYFRTRAFKLQNAGDTFGRFSALKDYDYKKLYDWFMLLDRLNSRSNYLPSMASYYYSQTQNTNDTKYIIDYLEERSDKNPEENWWWYYQAAFISNYIYKDPNRALKIAYKIKNLKNPNIPIWARQLAAIIHSKRGEDCEALIIINDLLAEYEKEESKRKIKNQEMNFMRYFVKKRVEGLKKRDFDPRECLRNGG